ncbi:hypothetical protein B0H10DRAFT_2023127 [Mycena sp. CBHHK59/15]|nr:hypothetical protein B0H10DRAFT_2023127 [Mycena sp. CBHHK59/15]
MRFQRAPSPSPRRTRNIQRCTSLVSAELAPSRLKSPSGHTVETRKVPQKLVDLRVHWQCDAVVGSRVSMWSFKHNGRFTRTKIGCYTALAATLRFCHISAVIRGFRGCKGDRFGPLVSAPRRLLTSYTRPHGVTGSRESKEKEPRPIWQKPIRADVGAVSQLRKAASRWLGYGWLNLGSTSSARQAKQHGYRGNAWRRKYSRKCPTHPCVEIRAVPPGSHDHRSKAG